MKVSIYILFLLLGCTYNILSQENVKYIVSYIDELPIETEQGWELKFIPVVECQTESFIRTDNLSVPGFPAATFSVEHTGKTYFYQENESILNCLGYQELEGDYIFFSGTAVGFFDYNINQSLTGISGDFSYKRVSNKTETGNLMIGNKEYSSINKVESHEIIQQTSSTPFTKKRSSEAYYLPNKQLPLLEIIKDTLWYNDSYRVENFMLYDSKEYTGIKESVSGHFSVYPNPVSEFLTVHLPDSEEGNIQLYNITGKLITPITKCTGNTTIDLSTLSAGIYLLEYITDNQYQTIKVIKR